MNARYNKEKIWANLKNKLEQKHRDIWKVRLMKVNQIRKKISLIEYEGGNMPKKEEQYELEVAEYISNLPPVTQKKAGVAIQDCRDMGRDWRWIKTALYKKGHSTWNKYGFGLMFKKSYNASVLETMRLEDEAEGFDIDEFLSILKRKEQYEFPEAYDPERVFSDLEADLREEKGASGKIPYFYHAPRGLNEPHREPYEPRLFCYYDQILEPCALELNIPVIRYGLDHGDIADEYLPFYVEALENYAGDVDE